MPRVCRNVLILFGWRGLRQNLAKGNSWLCKHWLGGLDSNQDNQIQSPILPVAPKRSMSHLGENPEGSWSVHRTILHENAANDKANGDN